MASGAPGELDPSFGADGRVLTRFPVNSQTFRPRSNSNALAIQLDGKIVSAGQALVKDSFAFAIIRYNLDGSLDASFGNGGKRATRLVGNDTALAVALQADGKIVSAGFATVAPGNAAFALIRYHANGSLDQSFGGDGKV